MTSGKTSRTEYPIEINVNGIDITSVIIDSHYKEKHFESITDAVILDLVKLLDGRREIEDSELGSFKYFKTILELQANKFYKLIWLLEKNKIYIGVVNAHRVNKKVRSKHYGNA